VLTKVWIEEEGRVKLMASLTGGGTWAALAEGVLRRFSGCLDSAVRLGGLLRWFHVVRTGQRATGGEKTEMAAELTCVGSRPN